jgi:hypothetical protein
VVAVRDLAGVADAVAHHDAPAGAARIGVAAVVLAILLGGAVWSIMRPTRGPHGWIAGTWIVPR